MSVTKKQFAVNALWKIMEQFSAKGISLIVAMILSRILEASDYGLLALTAVFTNLSDILIDGGFGTALVRKETVDEYDYSAVFSISSSMATVLYLILFFAAPFVSDYYAEPALTPVLRVIGLTFFIQAFTAVRTGIINRNMQFKLQFMCNSIASIGSGLLGILAAVMGLGVWALVVQRLSQLIILTVLLMIKVKWKISWKFDWGRIKEMFAFSIGVVGASLLNFVGGNIYSVVIGKKYSVSDLGYYDKGAQLPMQFSLYTFGAMSNVLLPTLSKSQSDLEKVKHIVRKVVGMTSFLIMPIMMGAALVSKELLVLFFSERWLPSVTIMQFNCIYYFATPYLLINVQVFFALGLSKYRVRTEIIRLALMISGLLLFGFVLDCTLNTLALVSGIIAVITSAVSYVFVSKLIDYRVSEVFSDMIKPFIATLIMGAAVWAVSSVMPFSGIVLPLIVKVIVGIAVYTACVLLLKCSETKEIIDMFRSRGKK